MAVPPFDQSLLAKVKATKGVAVAAGGVNDSATIFDDNGKRANKGQAPSLLFSATPRPFTPLRYSEGLPPSGPNDVTIDANTAKRLHWEVGDIVRVGAKAPVKRYRISGIGKFGDVSSFGGATIVVPTLREAQRITDKRGKLDEIDIALAPGAKVGTVEAELRRALPPSVDVRTGAEDAAEAVRRHPQQPQLPQHPAACVRRHSAVRRRLHHLQHLLDHGRAAHHRVRAAAYDRCLAAADTRSVLLESLVIGLSASIVGLFLGILAAKGISGLFKALNIDLPSQGTVLLTRTVIVSLLVGTIVTVLASLGPARRATRVPPLAALREGAITSRGTSRRRTVIAIVVTAIGIVLLSTGLFGGGSAGKVLGLMAIGAILVFIGVALLSSRLVPPIASAIGWPIERFRGVAGRLARENAERNPGRTAVTAAALMIGLALVTFVTVLGAGLRASINDAIDKSFAGDLVLSNKDGGSPIPTAAGRAAARIPGWPRPPRSTPAWER